MLFSSDCAARSASHSNNSIKFTEHSCWFHSGKEIIMEITTYSGAFGGKDVFSAVHAAVDVCVLPVIQGQTFPSKWTWWLWWDLGISQVYPKNLGKKNKTTFQVKFACSYFQTGAPPLTQRQEGGISAPIFCSPPVLFIRNCCKSISDKPDDLLMILSNQEHLFPSGFKESLHNN